MTSIKAAQLYPLAILLVIWLGACAGSDPATDPVSSTDPASSTDPVSSTDPATPPPSAPTEDVAESSTDLWWQRVHELCGKAFAGRLVSNDEADASFSDQPMTMHVRKCEPERIEIPFHVADNRSRTWVLTRKAETIHLQHDHRHEDGSEDQVTLYGGLSTDEGSAEAQNFPADEYSIRLFKENELSASVANTWSMEIVPGERFSYILRRPERHFQVDFDLHQAVEPPPAPWGHD